MAMSATPDQDQRQKVAIGKKITALRKRRGMSRDELAEKVGLSTGGLGYHERGDRTMSVLDAARYAEALGCSIDTLVGRTPDPLLAVVREEPIHILPRKLVKGVLSAKSWADLCPMWVDAGVHIGSVVHPEDEVVDERVWMDTQAKIRKVLERLGPRKEGG